MTHVLWEVNIHAACDAQLASMTSHAAYIGSQYAKHVIHVTEEGARTLDHKVKSLALYQLSHSGPCLGVPSLGFTDANRNKVTLRKYLFPTTINQNYRANSQPHLSGGSTAISCTRGRTGPLAGAQLSSSRDITSPPTVALLLLPPVANLAKSDMRGA